MDDSDSDASTHEDIVFNDFPTHHDDTDDDHSDVAAIDAMDAELKKQIELDWGSVPAPGELGVDLLKVLAGDQEDTHEAGRYRAWLLGHHVPIRVPPSTSLPATGSPSTRQSGADRSQHPSPFSRHAHGPPPRVDQYTRDTATTSTTASTSSSGTAPGTARSTQRASMTQPTPQQRHHHYLATDGNISVADSHTSNGNGSSVKGNSRHSMSSSGAAGTGSNCPLTTASFKRGSGTSVRSTNSAARSDSCSNKRDRRDSGSGHGIEALLLRQQHLVEEYYHLQAQQEVVAREIAQNNMALAAANVRQSGSELNSTAPTCTPTHLSSDNNGNDSHDDNANHHHHSTHSMTVSAAEGILHRLMLADRSPRSSGHRSPVPPSPTAAAGAMASPVHAPALTPAAASTAAASTAATPIATSAAALTAANARYTYPPALHTASPSTPATDDSHPSDTDDNHTRHDSLNHQHFHQYHHDQHNPHNPHNPHPHHDHQAHPSPQHSLHPQRSSPTEQERKLRPGHVSPASPAMAPTASSSQRNNTTPMRNIGDTSSNRSSSRSRSRSSSGSVRSRGSGSSSSRSRGRPVTCVDSAIINTDTALHSIQHASPHCDPRQLSSPHPTPLRRTVHINTPSPTLAACQVATPSSQSPSPSLPSKISSPLRRQGPGSVIGSGPGSGPWLVVLDPAVNQQYYVHRVSGKATWRRPHDL